MGLLSDQKFREASNYVSEAITKAAAATDLREIAEATLATMQIQSALQTFTTRLKLVAEEIETQKTSQEKEEENWQEKLAASHKNNGVS